MMGNSDGGASGVPPTSPCSLPGAVFPPRSAPRSSPSRAERARLFATFYTAHYQHIAAYVRRRVPAEDADDVTAQVFALAWRRFDRVPPPPQDRLWLFGVARNNVAGQRRSARRRLRLHTRLAQDAVTAAGAGPEADPRRELIRAAISALRPLDREAVRLVLWDGLSHAEAAAVLQCSPNALELRYRRARNAIRDAVIAARPDYPARPACPVAASRAGHGPLAATPRSTARTESS
jgi:RNA polymerase sigma factor (sigma-70 family)